MLRNGVSLNEMIQTIKQTFFKHVSLNATFFAKFFMLNVNHNKHERMRRHEHKKIIEKEYFQKWQTQNNNETGKK